MSNSVPRDVEMFLSDPAYRLVEELRFQEMLPFVLKQIRKRGIMSVLYLAINLLLFILITFYMVLRLTEGSITWGVFAGQTLGGIFAGSILVIPIHELLHGLAYRILGAKKIRFGADPQQLIFYVTADRYPVSGGEICFLAMIPFICINITTVALALSLFPGGLLFSGILLLSHNIMCIGDFAVSNYVLRNKRKIYSFDIPERQISYFYEKAEE